MSTIDEKKEEVFDSYVDHATHNVYKEDCSECFKNVAEFNKVDDDDINFCKNCSVPCANLYCDECQYQLEQDPNYFD